ncbi:MAG: LysR family transcriptional regulator [Oscillospiraceae bacterium]|nr:LysR family transcriptional regulator [Oscillospiraceae bacterium]
MNAQSLYYFIAVAQDLNISRTAKRLYITQQALSEQIRKLEKQYGAVFFERRPRLKLTDQGEQMLAYAKNAVQAEQALAAKLRAAAGGSVRLSIAAPSDSALAALPHVLGKYMPEHPDVTPEIHTGTPAHLRRQLEEERIDVYFGPHISLPAGYAAERITRDDLYFIISRGMLCAALEREGRDPEAFIREKRRGISIAEACRFPIALPPAETAVRTAIELACAQQGGTPNLAMETSSNEMMFDICSMGLSSSFVTRQLLFSRIKEGRLPETVLYFPATGLDGGAWSCAACRKGAAPDYIADFMKCCRETLREIEAQMQELLPQGEE